jgi:colanic acid/amylovoran biosynthesis protein
MSSSVSPGRSITIGLLWHSTNSDNLGVGALTVAHMAIVDEVAAELGVVPDYVIMGAADVRKPYVVRPDLSIKDLRNKDFLDPFNGMWPVARRCGLVLDIGGGDSFTDIYGAPRARRMLASKIMTLLAGRPLVHAPQTIGPFERPWVRRMASAVLSRGALTVTRDRLSTAYLDEIGFSGKRLEATDVALRLPYDKPAPRAEGGPVRVGLNVSGLLFNGGYSGANQFGLAADYPTLVRGLIEDFRARPEVELTLVGHVISELLPIEDDQRVCAALAEEYGLKLAPAFGHPSEAKSFIAGLDFFMGARMHACIAAFSSGVPVLPMAYSRKFSGLFGTLGYDALADCKTETAEAIRAKAAEAYEGREALGARAKGCLHEGLRRLDLYKDELRALMDAGAR